MRWMCALVLVGILTVPLLATGEDEPSVNDEAKAFAKEFKKSYKKKPEGELLEDIDKLVEYLKNKAVDEKSVRKALLSNLAKTAGMRDTVIVAHVMKKCFDVGEATVSLLCATLAKELKKKVPEDRVYEAAMQSLGKIHSENPKAVKTLTGLLKYKENDVVTQAAYALTFYKKASGKVRRGIFEEILKQIEGVYSGSQSNNETQKRKWAIVGEDGMTALNELSVPPRTAPDFPTPREARKWFNDNKKASWKKRD